MNDNLKNDLIKFCLMIVSIVIVGFVIKFAITL
jgi:hypothetical protein